MVWGSELRQKEESEGIVTYALLIGGHGMPHSLPSV